MIIARKTTASDAEKISELIYSVMHLFLAEPDGKGAEHFLQMTTRRHNFVYGAAEYQLFAGRGRRRFLRRGCCT